MKYLLALTLFAFAVPAWAADWELVWQSDAQLNTVFHYIDRSSIRESGSHKLVWIKYTQIWKPNKNPAQIPNGLSLYEFDCVGHFLPNKNYNPSGSENKYMSREWKLIIPDNGDGMQEAEQAVCGK